VFHSRKAPVIQQQQAFEIAQMDEAFASGDGDEALPPSTPPLTPRLALTASDSVHGYRTAESDAPVAHPTVAVDTTESGAAAAAAHDDDDHRSNAAAGGGGYAADTDGPRAPGSGSGDGGDPRHITLGMPLVMARAMMYAAEPRGESRGASPLSPLGPFDGFRGVRWVWLPHCVCVFVCVCAVLGWCARGIVSSRFG
jgi:hypothetical protein